MTEEVKSPLELVPAQSEQAAPEQAPEAPVPPPPQEVEWVIVNQTVHSMVQWATTQKAKVPGGWLYHRMDAIPMPGHLGLTNCTSSWFVPDVKTEECSMAGCPQEEPKVGAV